MTAITSTVSNIIQQLNLQPHPEGGFYRRTYCSDERITRAIANGASTQRHASTGIYYLLHDQA